MYLGKIFGTALIGQVAFFDGAVWRDFLLHNITQCFIMLYLQTFMMKDVSSSRLVLVV